MEPLREPLGLSSLEPELDTLFAFGIDPVDGGLPIDQPGDWPTVNRTRAYNEQLRQQLDAAVGQIAARDPRLAALGGGRLLEVAIEHRLMHVETLGYMLHQLPLDRKLVQRLPPPISFPARPQASIEIPAGTATLGLPRAEHGPFGWDNEFEEHRVEVPAFAIDRFNVTNGDYLQLVRDGGYSERSFWSEAAWQWINSRSHRHPGFWIPDGESGRGRAMCAEFRFRSIGRFT